MLVADLALAGLDLALAFDARTSAESWLVDPARPCGLVIGNTRALWAPFCAAYAADPSLRDTSDPLERYVERVIDAALPPGARVFYAHRPYDGAYLPFQRVAAAVGLGELTPAHLLVHPIFGPWVALRALVLTAGAPPSPAAPRPVPGAHTPAGEAALATALAATGPDAWRAWLAVRDACPIGRAHRYSAAQIRYHYTKDPRALTGENSGVDGDLAIR